MGSFTALEYQVKNHKSRAKELLDEDGKLCYEMATITNAIAEAHANWDDELIAFYAIELHAAVEDLLFAHSSKKSRN